MVFCAAVVVMVKMAKKATSLKVKNITVVAIWVCMCYWNCGGGDEGGDCERLK